MTANVTRGNMWTFYYVAICYVAENIKIYVTRENTYKEIYLSSLLPRAYVNLCTYKNTRVQNLLRRVRICTWKIRVSKIRT